MTTHRRYRLLGLAIAAWLCAGAGAGAVARAGSFPIDLAAAKKVFTDAQTVSEAEGGRLWGEKLYAKMLLVDPETRAVVSNEPDPQGVLHARDGCYVGTLPESLIISNAPTEWEGQHWTMLMWFTIPDDRISLHVMLAHELFHQMQYRLHLVAQDMPAPDLDMAQGRLWLQLEWRALAAALITSGPVQTAAIRDALAFRAKRHALYPNSAKAEASQEIAEGVPEYTGVVAGVPDVQAARWHAAGKLAHPDLTVSFVRSFAYTSGPAYGLLLDERSPGWRKALTIHSDLAALLNAALKDDLTASAEARAPYYGAAEIRMAEEDRAAKADTEKRRYRALLVDGPTLTLPKLGHFSFNPNTLLSLGDAGTVYPTFHAIAEWGTLDVTGGILVPGDFKGARLAAPTAIDGPHLKGPGWTVELARGWSAVPASGSGSYMLQKR